MTNPTKPVIKNMAHGRYELYCPTCGESVIPPLPSPMSEFLAYLKRFEKRHKHDGTATAVSGELIEYRIKTIDIKKREWQQIHAIRPIIPFGTSEQVDSYITVMAQATRAVEVRWNWIGSPQGHYVKGPQYYGIGKDEIFDMFEPLLRGTDDTIVSAILLLSLENSPPLYQIENILNDGGLIICASCSTWAYCQEDYCEFCEEATR